jgi:phosphatidylglycerophosphate synthase
MTVLFITVIMVLWDLLDGVITRRRGEESIARRMIDTSIDKLCVSSVTCLIVSLGVIPSTTGIWTVFYFTVQTVGTMIIVARKGIFPVSNNLGRISALGLVSLMLYQYLSGDCRTWMALLAMPLNAAALIGYWKKYLKKP